MKLFAIFITNKVKAYGGAVTLRQVKLFICIPDFTNNYDESDNRLLSTEINSVAGSSSMNNKTINYSYDEGKTTGISYDDYDSSYTYDAIDRLTNRTSEYSSVSNRTVQNENYVYQTYGVYTTNLLTLIDDQTSANKDRTATYDENGYVTSISYNGKTYSYEYDGAGRLISESKNGAVQEEYSYDSANNIQKDGLTYTNGKLTAVDGAQIVYDALGNPTKYKGNTFTWQQGRKLVSGSMNGKSFTYRYDGNGMRYEKIVSGTTTSYYYNGTQLLMESKNRQRTWFVYGVTGIEGIIVDLGYREDTYYFDKNTLGDVVALRDTSGNIVATYEYDAWGNCTVMNANGSRNTSSTFIGNVNPIRYRGYYYDVETGFYYLQTRYYDPTICRFINADSYELVAELSCFVGELNMYAYCNNNPIMYTDESGTSVLGTIALIISISALIFGAGEAAYEGVTAYDNGVRGWELFDATAEGFLTGAAIGTVIGGVISAFVFAAPAISSFLGSSFTLAGGSTAAITLTGAQIAAVGATAVLGTVMFSKGSGARFGHNQHENDQFRDAMGELGYRRSDPQWEKAHHALTKYKKSGGYFDEYHDLLEFIKKVLGR